MKIVEDCDPDVADTAFMVWATSAVFIMIPGLGLFEAGLVRSKSALSILAQVFAGTAVLSVLWIVVGFSLVFSPSHGGFIGGFDYTLLVSVGNNACMGIESQIPAQLYAGYEMMFAAITPLLITGAFAERLTFNAFLVFIVLWSLAVYYPVAHWIWGGGWLAKRGVLDFAGGIVVHTTAGAAAIVSALYLGPRSHHGISHTLKPHSVPLTLVGGGLLWMGWFGFNGGSAYRAGGDAASAVVNTHVAGCATGVVWLAMSWYREGQVHIVDVMNGIIAGFAGITPVAGYCTVGAALGLGVVLGVAADLAVILLIDVAGIDDALEVSAVHGATGVVGALATGFIASPSVSSAVIHPGIFIHGGSAFLLGEQVLAIVVTAAWAGVWTWIILFGINHVLFPVRATLEEEEQGLDVALHEGHAYLFSRLAIYEELFPEDATPEELFASVRAREALSINDEGGLEPLLRSHVSYADR